MLPTFVFPFCMKICISEGLSHLTLKLLMHEGRHLLDHLWPGGIALMM